MVQWFCSSDPVTYFKINPSFLAAGSRKVQLSNNKKKINPLKPKLV
jgi:hypothetical protein